MSDNAETFAASRWTRGNLFFPTRITVTPQHVSRVQPRLFGSSEESIAIGKVASVQICFLFKILAHVLSWMFVIGMAVCAVLVIPITAYRLFSVLFEKDYPDEINPRQ